MRKLFVTGLFLACASIAQAFPGISENIESIRIASAISANATQGLQWNVGDQADYNMSIGFIKGKSHIFVREDAGTSYWLQQDVDLGFMGKQKIEIQLNKADGQILKLLVNGKEQTPPNSGDMEVIDMHEDTVTVPAGTFKAVYIKLKSKKDGSISEAWVNPKEVPITGNIKMLGTTQMGKMVQELTGFKFATP